MVVDFMRIGKKNKSSKGNKRLMQLYRFSPIQNKEQLLKAAEYIVTKTSELCKKVIGQSLPISSITIFSHYQDEFEQLKKILLDLGKLHSDNNGPRVALHKPLNLGSNTVTHIRVRKPDPYRMQVGCNDFEVEDYIEFKKNYLPSHPDNLRLINRADYEMIEFFDPDYGVLAYVVSNKI
ncbi:hypothetical protein HYV81_00490 [Candidatus Woesearchaeota archaeon]|nr:hypothetical protein [Candidatus Woesearchaeota archaeon]